MQFQICIKYFHMVSNEEQFDYVELLN